MALKKLRPPVIQRIIFRLKAGRSFGVRLFLSAFAISTGLVTLVAASGITLNPRPLGLLLAFLLLSSTVAALIKGKGHLIPSAFVDELGVDGHYMARFCDTRLLSEACELTQPYYDREYVPDNVAEQWRLKNPKAFVAILNSDNELCSCFGVIGLTEEFWKMFISGRVSDTALRADDILSFTASRNSQRLYLSGIVVKDPSTYCGHKRARVMLWTMLVYLKRLYRLNIPRKLYALAVTKESSRLLKNLNFLLESEGRSRSDRCDLYSYELTKASWDTLHARVGDFSRMCKCEY